MCKYVCILQNTITWVALYKTYPQVKLQYCLANIGSNSHIGNLKSFISVWWHIYVRVKG
jgi:hypothetical protein